MNINININSVDVNLNSRQVQLISKENPFKKGSLQCYLLDFIIQEANSLSRYSESQNNTNLITFLAKKKKTFYLDLWNSSKLFETAISLSLLHGIIKITKTSSQNTFGLYAEDGLFDVLAEPKFTNHLPTGDISENHKLLWLSLYMNQKIRTDYKVPSISFGVDNFNYGTNKFEIKFNNFPYEKLLESNLNIPFSSFTHTWHTKDWIELNSRGLFHHIGDQVGFFYGANSVGTCYFVAKNQYQQLVTLSTAKENSKIRVESESHSPSYYYDFGSNVHNTDFEYIYGVPKGNSSLYGEYLTYNTDQPDCLQNDYGNILKAEVFWNNHVFLTNAHRKIFVGSIEDKIKDILVKSKDIFSVKQYEVIEKIIANETITKKEYDIVFNDPENQSVLGETELKQKLLENSSFFMKSLAHKTVCEMINPPKNLDLGFFMKHNGKVPEHQKMNILDLLEIYNIDSKLEKPLLQMKKSFISNFIKNKEHIDLWEDDSKKGFVFSEIVSMKNEYRIFIINNKVAATSACFRNTVAINAWQNGRFDPRLANGHNDQNTHINRERVFKYAKFARKFTKEMRETNSECHSYVLDVAWCEEKKCVVPIELNSITWSGGYQINMHRVCAAIIKKPFNYEALETFLYDKNNLWKKMITDKIFEASMYNLCGLDRTLKANTLPKINLLTVDILNHIENLKKEASINLVISENLLDDKDLSLNLMDDDDDYDDYDELLDINNKET